MHTKLKKRLYVILLSIMLLSTLQGFEFKDSRLSQINNIVDYLPTIDPIIVSVSGASPVVTNIPPDDPSVEVATTGTIQMSYWSASDSDGDYNSFDTYRADNPSFTGQSSVQSQEWTGSTQQITYFHPKTFLSTGNWYYRTLFIDGASNAVYSGTTIMTNVDTTSPSINAPVDQNVEVSGSRTISWGWTDNYLGNSGELWRVYINSACSGTIIYFGTWSSSSGSYGAVVSPTTTTTYTMCVWDDSGNLDSDSVTITVTSAQIPVLNAPVDNTMEDGSATRSFAWTWTDNFDNPTDSGDWIVRSQASAFGDCTTGSILNSGTWGGTAGSRTESDLSPSATTYYCIRVTDDGNNWDDDFATITVTSAVSPILNAPVDDSMEAGGSRTIAWTWTDNFDNPTGTGTWDVFSKSTNVGSCGSVGWGVVSNGNWDTTAGARNEVISPSATLYYCIKITDEAGNFGEDVMLMTVTASANPILNAPTDSTMEDGISTRDIDWTWTDNFDNPTNTGDYEVRSSTSTFGGVCTGGSVYDSGTWSSTAGSYSISAISPSVTTYYCIRITDDAGNIDDDEVAIIVTTAQAPIDNNPVDLTLEDGSGTRNIDWTWTDNFDNPTGTGDYEVRSATGSLPTAVCTVANYPTSEVGITNWDGTGGSYSHTGLSPSATIYYCIRIIDETGNIDDDFVTLTITSAGAPVLNAPANPTMEDGVSTRNIDWTWSDNFANPTGSGSWEVRSDTTTFSGVCTGGSIDTSGTWETTTGAYSHTGLSPSVTTYYCIRVIDEAGLIDDDEVSIDVITAQVPVHTDPPNDDMEDGSATRDIFWSWSDNFNNPINTGTYEVRSTTTTFSGVCTGGTQEHTGNWDGTADSFNDVGNSPTQTTEYCIRVTDEAGNFADEFMIISVTSSANPVSNSPSDVDFEIGYTGSNAEISWSWTDNFDNPISTGIWEVRKHSVSGSSCTGSLVNSGTWDGTGSSRLEDVDVETVDNYYCIIVTDETGNQATDIIFVDVSAQLIPQVTVSPSDDDYEDGNVIVRNIQWTATDSYADYYIIESRLNAGTWSVERSSTSWTSGVATSNYDIGSLTVGTWDFRITFVEDITHTVNATNTDIMTVTVATNQAPQITDTPVPISYEEGDPIVQNIHWTATDSYPDTYIIERQLNGGGYSVVVSSTTWTSGVDIIDYDIGGLSVGTWDFKITFYEITTEGTGKTAQDIITLVVSDNSPPVITINPTDIMYEADDFGNLEGWWNFEDGTTDGMGLFTQNDDEISTINLANSTWNNEWTNSGTAGIFVNDDGSAYSGNQAPFYNDPNVPVISHERDDTGQSQLGVGDSVLEKFTTYTVSVWFIQNTAGITQPYLRPNPDNLNFGNLAWNGDTNTNNWAVDTWINIQATLITSNRTETFYISSYLSVIGKYAFNAPQVERRSFSTDFVDGSRTGVDIGQETHELHRADSLGTWAGQGVMSIASIDTTNKRSGTGSITGIYPNNSATYGAFRYFSDFGDLSKYSSDDDYLTFWWYISDITQVDPTYGQVEIGNTLDTNEYYWNVASFYSTLTSGWNYIKLQMGDATQGSVDWTTGMDHFRVYYRGTGTNEAFIVNIDQFELQHGLGVINNAVRLNSTSFTEIGGFDNGITTELSISFWFKYESDIDQFGRIVHSSNNELQLYSLTTWDQGLRMVVGDSGTFNPITADLTNGWNHLVIIVEFGRIRGYLNGILDENIASSFTSVDMSSITLTFGKYHGVSSNRLNGWLDDFRLYSDVLTFEEIDKLYGMKNQTISWTANDVGSATNYVIQERRNGGAWNTVHGDFYDNNVAIDNYHIGSEIGGFYEYRAIFYDHIQNFVTSSLIEVDITPSIRIDEEYYIGQDVESAISTEKSVLVWYGVGNDYSPNYTYEILRDNSQVASGTWSNSSVLYYQYGSLPSDTYNFTLVLYQRSGVFTSHVYVVTYTSVAPNVYIDPVDTEYSYEVLGNRILWGVLDEFPDSYTIYRNDTIVQLGSWNIDNYIIISTDGLDVGVYNYTLAVSDIAGNTAYNTVFVTVNIDSISPVFRSTPTDLLVAFDSTGNTLTWDIFDKNDGTYIFYRNGTNVDSGAWSVGIFSLTIDGLSIDTLYNFTLVITDALGNTHQDQVWVYVQAEDGDPNIIITPDDFAYSLGDTGNAISWSAVDNFPATYNITRNGGLVQEGIWDSSDFITILVDGLGVGSYTFILYVYDTSGNVFIDTVVVSVV